MKATDTPPAIRRIDTDREDICALEIVGHFTAADLENAYGLLDAAYSLHDSVDLLVRITRYDGFDWSVMFDEATIGNKIKALSHVHRYAVVGGPGWMHAAIGIFAPLTSIETRHFVIADEAAAWAWIGANPVDPK